MTLRNIAFTSAALVGMVASTIAAADTSYFEYQRNLDNSAVIELGSVRSAADGVVEIYTYHGDQLGRLLGTEAVQAGANADVRVNIGGPANVDVIALLKVDGQTIASRDYIVD